MDLKDVTGLAPTTIAKLREAGIKTAEQLALVDTKRRKIQGVTAEKLVEMRRAAQKSIFAKTASRLRHAASVASREARRGAESLEVLIRKGAEQALAAAKQAEAAASDALAHAQSAAADLAEQAALKAVNARRVAEQQIEALSHKLSSRGAKNPTVQKYWNLLQRAEGAAKAAAEKAVASAQVA
ncbi:MAG TPA: hypothetical protein VI818_06865, partial [Candidatus Thermoplasmatota archaeon]|nr:hypothetical protein [Candidatus Thermoplasmatota archaeon]